jgi:UDP-N-acetylmuramoyl-tripeptide--D-alanyl-D-alanine ligase
MKKAIFLDRDGTLNVDYGYIHRNSDLVFIDGSIEALKKFVDRDFLLIIISNQSGVGRGYFTYDEMMDLNNEMLKRLNKYGVIITDIFICPHSPDSNCVCRKPSPYMIEKAIKKYEIDRVHSYMLGDKQSDVESGIRAGVKSFLITKKYTINYWANIILGENE